MHVAAMNTAPSIAPAAGMVTDADPGSGQASQFALFSESWIELQGYAGAASQLPASRSAFEDKYGAVASSRAADECIDAMKDVQAAVTEFGEPKALRCALIHSPNLLATKAAPQQIYTHTVWLGQRVADTSARIVSGYESVLREIPGLPPREQVASLKAYLFDQATGPLPLSKRMSEEVGLLITKIGRFEQKIGEYNDRLRSHTRGSSSMIAEVDTTIGGLVRHIGDLEKTRDEAYKAWRDFTNAAVTTSVGAVLIGGLLAPLAGGLSLLPGPAAIALGVGLGVKAAQCRSQYNRYCAWIDGQDVELIKKQRLRSDLGDFDIQIRRVAPALTSFLQRMQAIEGVWVRMTSDMLAIGNSINESNVGALPFLVKAESRFAAEAWKSINDSARQFTAGSLVDYTTLSFGDRMAESAASRRVA